MSLASVAVVVFADTGTHADLARVVDALLPVKASAGARGAVRPISGGAGTDWGSNCRGRSIAPTGGAGHR